MSTICIGRPVAAEDPPGHQGHRASARPTRNIKANIGEYERYQPADIGIAGDAETSLPWLIQAIEKEMTPARKAVAAARGQKLKDSRREAHPGGA